MGLDISVYEGLKPIADPCDEGEGLYESYVRPLVNPAFPGRADPIIDGQAYSFENQGGFPAGGHGNYNEWRERLAERAGYPRAPHISFDGETVMLHAAGCWAAGSGRFYELINFSDCEGVIGSVVSAKLAVDFAEMRDEIHRKSGGDTYFKAKYDSWQQAFEMAARSGCVVFQ